MVIIRNVDYHSHRYHYKNCFFRHHKEHSQIILSLDNTVSMPDVIINDDLFDGSLHLLYCHKGVGIIDYTINDHKYLTASNSGHG